MKMKICGMRDPENIRQILEFDPDYMGFIFYDKSSRFVTEAQMQDVIKLSFGETERVGVFVNETFDKILSYADKGFFDVVQLHGDETPEMVEKLKNEGLEVIKVFSIGDDFNFGTLKSFQAADYFLFDTKGKQRGGTGIKFDWQLLKNAKIKKPFFLSGGLEAADVEEIKSLELKNLFGLDFNSMLESAPAIKDKQRVKALFDN